MSDGFGAVIALLGGLIFIVMLVGIANYVLMALGLMKMAENQGIENPWLAWVPVGNLFIVGKIIKTVDLGEKKYEKAEMILVIGCAGAIVLSMIPFIGGLASLAFTILTLLCLFKLFKMYEPNNAVLYLILSIVFAVIAPGILIFKIKDNTPAEQ